jgi:hypothetical protein
MDGRSAPLADVLAAIDRHWPPDGGGLVTQQLNVLARAAVAARGALRADGCFTMDLGAAGERQWPLIQGPLRHANNWAGQLFMNSGG